MSFGTWLVLVVVGVPLLATLVWALVRESVVRVPAGSLGLLVVKGKSTDRSLTPGVHWVPALRKRQCVSYPSVELSYRADPDGGVPTSVEAFGPPLPVVLGDRAEAVVGYTLRFRLDPELLRTVHDRFGTAGYWSAARDGSAAAISAALGEEDVSLDSFYPGERAALEQRLRERVTAGLAPDGLVVTGFSLGSTDLGRAGETVQATVRARLELAREQAEAAIQKLRVRNDAALAKYLADVGDTALRYRQTEVWRDLAARPDAGRLSLSTPPLPGLFDATQQHPASEPATAAEEGAK